MKKNLFLTFVLPALLLTLLCPAEASYASELFYESVPLDSIGRVPGYFINCCRSDGGLVVFTHNAAQGEIEKLKSLPGGEDAEFVAVEYSHTDVDALADKIRELAQAGEVPRYAFMTKDTGVIEVELRDHTPGNEALLREKLGEWFFASGDRGEVEPHEYAAAVPVRVGGRKNYNTLDELDKRIGTEETGRPEELDLVRTDHSRTIFLFVSAAVMAVFCFILFRLRPGKWYFVMAALYLLICGFFFEEDRAYISMHLKEKASVGDNAVTVVFDVPYHRIDRCWLGGESFMIEKRVGSQWSEIGAEFFVQDIGYNIDDGFDLTIDLFDRLDGQGLTPGYYRIGKKVTFLDRLRGDKTYEESVIEERVAYCYFEVE